MHFGQSLMTQIRDCSSGNVLKLYGMTQVYKNCISMKVKAETNIVIQRCTPFKLIHFFLIFNSEELQINALKLVEVIS